MKGLVVGGGSIGTRHLNNLMAFGVNQLSVVEPEVERRTAIIEKGVTCFSSLERGFEWKPNFVIIATPTYLHVTQAVEAARKGFHLFVEKPLSHTEVGLKELLVEVERRGLVSLVGCNMRFHPGPAKVKEVLEQGSIGRVLFTRIHTGSYLPMWRPEQDYRKSYSANAKMGGGCILDCIHEIDLAHWYLGEVEEVFCFAEQLSNLEIDVEDVAFLICKHANRSLSEIHLDYVQQTYERGCQVVGEKGSIFWDFREGMVRWYNAANGHWQTFTQPENWQINQMYLDEMKHFLECIESGSATMLPIPEAIKVMRTALGAKVSARSGYFVSTKSIAL